MKQRLILFILCIVLLAGVLYWLIPKATAFFEQINAMGTATAEPGMPTATTPTIIPTREATPGTTPQAATISGLSMENTSLLAGIAVGFLLLVQIVYSLSRSSSSSSTKYGSAHFARGSELREFQVSRFSSLFSRRWQKEAARVAPRAGKNRSRADRLFKRAAAGVQYPAYCPCRKWQKFTDHYPQLVTGAWKPLSVYLRCERRASESDWWHGKPVP